MKLSRGFLILFLIILSTGMLLMLGGCGSKGKSQAPEEPAGAGAFMYFKADDGEKDYGDELWKTDGTISGTVMVKDINPIIGQDNYARGSGPSGFTKINRTVYFVANDGIHGRELWRSDGNAATTSMVKDIQTVNEGAEYLRGSHPSGLINMNGILFFTADDGKYGWELWRSDGSASGTHIVEDINTIAAGPDEPTEGSTPKHFTIVNNRLYFTADDGIHGRELWRSDGSAGGGTSMVYDINKIIPGASSSPNFLTNVDGTLYFIANDGDGNALWKLNVLSGVPVKVRNTSTPYKTFPGNLTNVNGTLFFQATDTASDYELWKSDGNYDGTVRVKDINEGGWLSSPSYLTNMNGILYFRAEDKTGTQLWRSDGSEPGTYKVSPAMIDSLPATPADLINVNGTLFFRASVGGDTELWRTDGTPDGTRMVENINGSGSSDPALFREVNGILCFAADDGKHGFELWRTDGTPEGTFMLRDIDTGPGSGVSSN